MSTSLRIGDHHHPGHWLVPQFFLGSTRQPTALDQVQLAQNSSAPSMVDPDFASSSEITSIPTSRASCACGGVGTPRIFQPVKSRTHLPPKARTHHAAVEPVPSPHAYRSPTNWRRTFCSDNFALSMGDKISGHGQLPFWYLGSYRKVANAGCEGQISSLSREPAMIPCQSPPACACSGLSRAAGGIRPARPKLACVASLSDMRPLRPSAEYRPYLCASIMPPKIACYHTALRLEEMGVPYRTRSGGPARAAQHSAAFRT